MEYILSHMQKDGLICFIDNHQNEITSYTMFKNGFIQQYSYEEKIYSNRTEYYINGEFIGYEPNLEYINKIKEINKRIFENNEYSYIINVLNSPDFGFFMLD